MAVFVDFVRLPHGRGQVWRLCADDSSMLYDAIDALGIEQRRVNEKGTTGEHVIVSLAERSRALALGVISRV